MDLSGARAHEASYKVHASVVDDDFYKVPSKTGELSTADLAAGSLIKVEATTDTSLYTLAPNLALSRILYQSKTSTGRLVPVSGYVLWPYSARLNHVGKQSVVVWAHGTSGASAECAPSNNRFLWHHFQAPYQLALYGYVVIATDYAGLGVGVDAVGNPIVHEYLTGCAQAGDVFYSILAAREAFPDLSTDFVVVGSSQGGGAAWAFAEELVHEPLPGHLGTVTLSPVTRILDLPLDEPIFPFVLLNLVPTLQRNHGLADLNEIFTPKGVQNAKTLYELQGTSTINFALQGPDLIKPDWHTHSSIQSYQSAAANGGKKISGPMLIIQGGDDPIISTPTVEAAVDKLMDLHPNSCVEYHLLPNVTHAPVMYAGLPAYLDWIAARFRGDSVPQGCRRSVARLARPAGSQQKEANWFVQKQTETCQRT